jgi:hypothetical protein
LAGDDEMAGNGTESGPQGCSWPQRENPRQGNMKRHRTIVWIFTLMGALLVLPAAASASGPLLSGYGGPGAGEQVILGSQVIGGSSGGGASSGSSSIETPSTESQADSSSEQESSSTVAQTPQTSTSSPHADIAKGSLQTHTPTSSAITRTQPRPRTPKASREGSLPSSSAVSQASYDTRLGLSSSDLLEVILVAGVLTVLALWTRRLARLQP